MSAIKNAANPQHREPSKQVLGERRQANRIGALFQVFTYFEPDYGPTYFEPVFYAD